MSDINIKQIECLICDKHFASRFTLTRHTRNVHSCNENSTNSLNKLNRHICPESDCYFQFSRCEQLTHLKELHSIDVVVEELNFETEEVTGISAVLGAMNSQLNDEGSSHYKFNVPKPPPNTSVENIVWVDMEMTGLDPDKDHVLEVACLVTDGNLNVLAEGPDLCINHPPEIMSAMNEWSTKQHHQSGLTSKCQTSGVPLREAERKLLDFVREWTPFNKCPLGGNTVYMDRMFLKKYMPEFEQHLHYRIIDVSSVKEICRRWYPEIYAKQPNKKEISQHRALADIKMSIEELKFYRESIFRKRDSSEAVNDQLQWC